jgi:hypothetical protein
MVGSPGGLPSLWRNGAPPTPPTGERTGAEAGLACETCAPLRCRSKRQHMVRARQCSDEVSILMVPAWRRGRRTMAQDLAKSSSRTRRKQRRALRVDRFGSERTQRNEVLSRKTGRQAKFCRTSDQNFLDAPRHATKFIELRASLQQILTFFVKRG